MKIKTAEGRVYEGKTALEIFAEMRLTAIFERPGEFPCPRQRSTSLLGKPHQGDSLTEFVDWQTDEFERSTGIAVDPDNNLDYETKADLLLQAQIEAGVAHLV